MNTKLEKFIEDNETSIKKLSELFANYKGTNHQNIGYEVARNNIIKWLDNFNSIEYYDFSLLLEVLNSIEFIKSDRIQNKLLELASDALTEQSFIAPLGEISESSFRLSSIFNRYPNFYNSLSSLLDNLEEESEIFLFDDFLNSGGQLITIFYSLLGINLLPNDINDEWENRVSLNKSQKEKLLKSRISIFYFKAFDEGITKIEKRLRDELKLKIKIHRYSPTNRNTGLFGDNEDQGKIEQGLTGLMPTEGPFINRRYTELTDLYLNLSLVGEKLLQKNKPNWDENKYKERKLGYNNYARLIVTDSNIPTISLTALWSGGEIVIKGHKVNWSPLFVRREKVLKHKSSQSNKTQNQVSKIDIHNFILHYYLKRNLVYDLDKIDELKEYHSNYFKYVINISQLENQLADISTANIFDYLCDYIKKTSENTPFLIDGFPGCGKSTFLSVLYIVLYKNYLDKKINEFPVYINLHKYNKEVYRTGESFQKQAITKLNKDLLMLETLVVNNDDIELIVIIDGNDEHSNLKVDLENYLFDKIENLKINSKIIGLRKLYEDSFNNAKKETINPFLVNNTIEIELNKINVNAPEFENFLNAFCLSEKYTHSRSVDQILNYLKQKIDEYKLKEIDIFTLTTLLSSLDDRNYNNCKTLSNYYIKYFESKKIDIVKSSEIAFKLYNDPLLLTEYDKNNTSWWKILKHQSIKEFLVAYYITDLLSNSNKIDNVDLKIFNHVYPFVINNFCKEIINSSKEYQIKCSSNIIKLFDSVSITAQTHFCYLLGRFENDGVKTKVQDFLIKQRDLKEKSLKSHLLIGALDPLTAKDKEELLNLRTIYISLTYLEEKESTNLYLTHLLTNSYFDNLNRGFHLEYYGDIPFDPSDKSSLKNEDTLKDFTKTYERLSKKLEKAIIGKKFYSMFLIELYTLCSLAQHRQVQSNLPENRREKIIQIINLTLERFEFYTYNDRLKKYFGFVQSVLSNKEEIKLGSFLIDLFKLKELKRTGWVVEPREIENPETVASHMYGVYLIAYFLLPERKKDNDEYDKTKIINMLLVHDLAEAYIGDLLPHQKNKEKEKQERISFDNLSLLGTYSGIANVSEIESLYYEFQKSETINGIIAREIDKLDNLLQLHIYKKDYPDKITDFESFKSNLIKGIRTTEGHSIKKIILELFE